MPFQSLLHNSSEEPLTITKIRLFCWCAWTIILFLKTHLWHFSGWGIHGKKIKNCCWKIKKVTDIGEQRKTLEASRISSQERSLCAHSHGHSALSPGRPQRSGKKESKWLDGVFVSSVLGLLSLEPSTKHQPGGESFRCRSRREETKQGQGVRTSTRAGGSQRRGLARGTRKAAATTAASRRG